MNQNTSQKQLSAFSTYRSPYAQLPPATPSSQPLPPPTPQELGFGSKWTIADLAELDSWGDGSHQRFYELYTVPFSFAEFRLDHKHQCPCTSANLRCLQCVVHYYEEMYNLPTILASRAKYQKWQARPFEAPQDPRLMGPINTHLAFLTNLLAETEEKIKNHIASYEAIAYYNA
ncbi:hypothetical protein HYFRA_00008964 [Hymenoscyphus fraxineus]|uniref:Uncharacterized protein n=1 Tax=Hymenoscyphus fraxineus TaxID=746836 RepID=A0A9N9KRD0_9HELO|nr:hypothetical protein HYFRA_00008964 [Hymenoscyphus fraxineus]